MGLRGPGARPKGTVVEDDPKLRKVLPWEAEGLSRLDRIVAFIEDMSVTAGKLAGQKMKVRDWQRDYLAATYREDGKGNRPVRTSVLSMARKNGKTGLAAPLALCHLCGPESEPYGEVYSAANDRDQAARIFKEISAIIDNHAELQLRLNLSRFKKQIEVMEGVGKGSIFLALSAEAKTKHGLSPSMIVYDELGQAPKRDMFEALDTAMGARENPLMMVISTQAADDNAVMSELVDYGIKVNSGIIEDASFHLTLYAADIDDDPWDKETWLKANPALDDFRSLEDVDRQAAQAQRVPSKENSFRNLILNQRVAAHVRFIAKAEWDRCNQAPDLETLKGKSCFGGLDLSASRDLTAWVLVFPDGGGGYDVVPKFFLPEDGIIDKSETDRVPWDAWAKQGFLTLIPGATIDPGYVADAIIEAAVEYDLQAVAYDRWRIQDLLRELSAAGQDEFPLEPFGQGFKDMAPAIDKLERCVAEGKIRHGGNPILNFCAANAVIEKDAPGNRKLTKAKSAGRIDGLVALTMALILSDRFEEIESPEFLGVV